MRTSSFVLMAAALTGAAVLSILLAPVVERVIIHIARIAG